MLPPDTNRENCPQPTTLAYTADLLAQAAQNHGTAAAEALSLAQKCHLDSLLEAATGLRNRVKGRFVNYSRKVFIPLTHLCRDYCGYCTFRADPYPGQQLYMTPDDVLEVAEA